MTSSPDHAWEPADQTAPRDAAHTVVLVEDDPADTILFEAAIVDSDPDLTVRCVGGADELRALAAREPVSCVVLDLGLPGLTGFEALEDIVARSPALAVVVLTGWGDAQAGIEALARGAQDYLVKGQVEGPTIARSIRFAIERKRSQLASAALAEAHLHQREQHRLERALMVTPALRRPDVAWTSRYISARAGIVSGDFIDGVELPDGTLRFVIGDVAGHGSDEAALGVTLRAGWRALALAELDPADALRDLESLLVTERPNGDEFATVCDLTIAPDLGSVQVRSAGHPPPILVGTGALADRSGRSPLGISFGRHPLTGTTFPLGERWSLVTYTDGLFEVRDRGGTILDAEAVPDAVERAGTGGTADPDALIRSFADRATEGWRDDVAVMIVERRPAPETGR